MIREFQKVNTEQIFLMWRNVAVSMLSLVLLHVLTMVLPPYLAPIDSTAIALFLYYQVVSSSYNRRETCSIVPYLFFIIVTTYTVLLVAVNVINVWGIVDLPNEYVFFDTPYLQSLILAPTGLFITVFVYLHRKRLSLCVDCKITNGNTLDRGRVGIIYSNESAFLLRNIMLVYTIITVIIYAYYIKEYSDASITPRDRIVFSMVAISVYLFDILYFAIRYYNLYLDLKDSDELLTPEDINVLGTRTYIRYYVIAGDSLYMSSPGLGDTRISDDSEIIDTPFIIKRNVSGFHEHEIRSTIVEQTGVKDGVLRFFYGRTLADSAGRKVLRYFYFLPGKEEDYPHLAADGCWISSDRLKSIYNDTPDRFTSICLADISRIALVTVTSKMYDEKGKRRIRLNHYHPSFTLREIFADDIDFSDDKWIRISLFNSDTSFFKLKRWWRKHIRRSYYE